MARFLTADEADRLMAAGPARRFATRFVRWLARGGHCWRCQQVTLGCRGHWFCDTCERCRQFYEQD